MNVWLFAFNSQRAGVEIRFKKFHLSILVARYGTYCLFLTGWPRQNERPLINGPTPRLIPKIKTGSHLAQVRGERTRAFRSGPSEICRCTMHPPYHPHARTLIITRFLFLSPYCSYLLVLAWRVIRSPCAVILKNCNFITQFNLIISWTIGAQKSTILYFSRVFFHVSFSSKLQNINEGIWSALSTAVT